MAPVGRCAAGRARLTGLQVLQVLMGCPSGRTRPWWAEGGDVGRPIFFLVNDRERALRELAGVLDRRFGADYQILSEQSPDKALIALARLAATSERVALLIGTPSIAGS